MWCKEETRENEGETVSVNDPSKAFFKKMVKESRPWLKEDTRSSDEQGQMTYCVCIDYTQCFCRKNEVGTSAGLK